ncbi:DNA polymerase III subunit gamma/tau [Marinisporobacter balticus]|uniref:DNA-directed DNA polymerase n=1 Tax=Marinisporobacter balticus TaxID=2018667 RepID=A0A4R2KP84_9FIRM|nr:DNA polymerase III subunit gamma/tau [Marinisporobacter balticus]TCO72649.1 DNA polymerase-3 subunit gamma/tau [Marinisporobacter balticus]
MGYVAIYRKWRPKVFEDVVGQDHITQTLRNQIKNDNIAHAYLFCGTRGTGKTSTAKILARAVNCLNPDDHNNPCNTCEICTGIQHESIMDVVEIDAASNNGVDDIRELRENVKYPPTKGRYKVYIIDEVHMLSTGAFNALLKTLEDPPYYVIFILATTEPHKIPATILSRCQRFDFKRVTEEDIVKRMSYICGQMRIKVEERGLKLIARNADGALRDALSILDQCVSFGVGEITYKDVIDILGVVSDSFLFSLVDYIVDRDVKNAIELIEELVASGKDIQQFIKDMIEHYRNLMMTKVSKELKGLINLSEENIERLMTQGKNVQMNTIMRTIRELSQTSVDAKWATQPRILLEVAVIKLCQPMMDQSVEGLIERIEILEKRIRSGEINIQKHGAEEKNKEEKDIKQENSINEKTPKQKFTPANFDGLKKGWNQILQVIKKRKISIYAVLIEGQLVKVEKNVLVVSFKSGFGFHKEAVAKSPYKEFVESVIAEMVGQKVHLKCVMEDELENLPVEEKKDSSQEDMEAKKIIEMFGEGLVEILED